MLLLCFIGAHALFFLITVYLHMFDNYIDADLFVGLSILDLFSRLALEIIYTRFLSASLCV